MTLSIIQSLLWLFVIMLAGTAGSLVDSLLGATMQAIYTCPTCQKETERHPLHTCGTPTIHARGIPWLNNDWVNTACALMGALLAGIVGVVLLSNHSTQSIPQTQYPSFQLSSPAFKMGAAIPNHHTCSGADQSPELRWDGYPLDSTRSLALVMQDPDAPFGVFTHWLIYNIPPGINDLPAGIPVDPQNLVTATQGKNSFGHLGYNGPCPPAGKVHRYFFTLYALNSTPDLEAGMDIQKLQFAIKDHILAQAQWKGTYGR